VPGSLVGNSIASPRPAGTPWWLDALGLVGSLVVLAVSGDQFVLGLARVVGSVRIRPTVAAALVGGFGTSIAELIVAGVSTAQRSPKLAIGSLVGSIVANVCLALVLAALVTPIRVDSATVRREMPLSVAAVALFAVFAVGGVTRAEGFAMLAVLVPVVAGLLLFAGGHGRDDPLGPELVEFADIPAHRSRVEAARAAAMVAVMLGGAELMVASTTGLAKHLGISQGFAGLTLVGVGTSAPLIAASIQAARRGEHDLVVGNVLGGNLFIALGGGAIVGLFAHGAPIGIGLLPVVLMVAVVLASWGALARGHTLSRANAVTLLVVYVATLPFVNR
jgi:cation:H+ antiporter